jgi:hypothetical protein
LFITKLEQSEARKAQKKNMTEENFRDFVYATIKIFIEEITTVEIYRASQAPFTL